MEKETEEKILNIIKKNHGYIRTGELLKEGVSNSYINTFVIDGTLTRLKRGLYRLTEKTPAESLTEVQAIVPSGIFCLGTALSHYQLTTYQPTEYQIALGRDTKVKLPEFPPIKLYYFASESLQEGVEEHISEGLPYRMYSRERTLCDAVKFRNKLGKDIVLESIKNYMKSKNKNMSKLYEFSRVLRVEKLMRNYLEILL